MSDERLNTMEMKLAELEKQFEDLNDVVLKQDRLISGLKLKIQSMEDTVQGDGENDTVLSTAQIAARDKPPHY